MTEATNFLLNYRGTVAKRAERYWFDKFCRKIPHQLANPTQFAMPLPLDAKPRTAKWLHGPHRLAWWWRRTRDKLRHIRHEQTSHSGALTRKIQSMVLFRMDELQKFMKAGGLALEKLSAGYDLDRTHCRPHRLTLNGRRVPRWN